MCPRRSCRRPFLPIPAYRTPIRIIAAKALVEYDEHGNIRRGSLDDALQCDICTEVPEYSTYICRECGRDTCGNCMVALRAASTGRVVACPHCRYNGNKLLLNPFMHWFLNAIWKRSRTLPTEEAIEEEVLENVVEEIRAPSPVRLDRDHCLVCQQLVGNIVQDMHSHLRRHYGFLPAIPIDRRVRKSIPSYIQDVQGLYRKPIYIHRVGLAWINIERYLVNETNTLVKVWVETITHPGETNNFICSGKIFTNERRRHIFNRQTIPIEGPQDQNWDNRKYQWTRESVRLTGWELLIRRTAAVALNIPRFNNYRGLALVGVVRPA